MLPIELKKMFDEIPMDDCSFSLIRADCQAELSLDFTLSNYSMDGTSQTWRVTTTGYKECRVKFGSADFIEITDDAPVLWQFTDFHGELFFTGKIKEPEKLFVDLYRTHKKLFDDYRPFDLSFDGNSLFVANTMYSNGQICKGPRMMLEQYGQCLERNGLKFSIVGKWRWVPPFDATSESLANRLKALLLGDSFVIAEDFNFQLLGSIEETL